LEGSLHQDTPFSRLVEQMQPDRDPSRNPLFQVLFSFHDSQVPDLEFAGLSGSVVERHNGSAKTDLNLIVVPRSEQRLGLGPKAGTEKLAILWEYNTDLFEASTISRMIGHFETLLEAAIAHPDTPIAELALLSPSERQQLFVEWNRTATEYARGQCLPQLFETQVERTPDALALVSVDSRMTYRELNHRANRLAHHLQALGVGPDVLVGLHLERSPELVVALLAVLKAGGAYVPLDPSYPKEWLAFQIGDARLQLLITQSQLASLHPQRTPQIVWLDREREAIEQRSQQNPVTEVGAGNLAYVLYTSGSTGQPKGVAIEHRSVVALVHWARQVFKPEEFAGVLASTSICFDLSVFELFVTLNCGGKVIIAENALQLPSLPAADEVTLVNTVPSAMAELLRMGGIPDSVRVVNLAGEPLPATLVEQIYQSPTIQKVYDLYGPTETTVYSTFALRKAGEPATIGRPLSNEQIYLLSATGQPVPVGVAGEMYIGGDGLARGYLHRPELTAEKFVPDPFGEHPGARLYKTGDLARYLPNGNIEFLGRMDNQVKIRGFRIELREIELALSRHPAVRECVVVDREEACGDKRLAAYLVPRDEAELSTGELRRFLVKKLPEHMIPSAFVIVKAIPRAPNGKVDRRALPVPGDQRSAPAETFIDPPAPAEKAVDRIWREVLKLERIGVHDNFFELGGHSLLATQVISRARNIFGVDVPMHRLFQTPTIAELAAFVEKVIQERLADLSEEEAQSLVATAPQGFSA